MKTVILLIGLLFSTFSLQAQDYEDCHERGLLENMEFGCPG